MKSLFEGPLLRVTLGKTALKEAKLLTPIKV